MNTTRGINLPEEEPAALDVEKAVRPSSTGWRVLRVGCLSLFLVMCAAVSSLAVALQSGPVSLTLPVAGGIKIGSDDFVLSNYSFQNGTTYYFDLDSGGTRNILQLEYLEDTRSLQLVLHHSTKGDRQENKLVTVTIP
ncbi:MAG TPA: hypothetical protein VLQ48_12885 [Chloroflexia bacterium]|nr:hypothetical protein [Chloroflexia bacterium]